MKSKVEELYVQTRSHPVYQHLFSLESVLSYPVPSSRESGTFLRFLVYRRGRTRPGQPGQVYRPYAHLSIEYPSGRLAEYSDLRFTEGAPASPTAELIGETPNPATTDLSFDEIVSMRSDLFTAIEAVMPLMGKRTLTTQEQSSVVKCRELFETLVETGLLPYYRTLNPDFFELLEVSSV